MDMYQRLAAEYPVTEHEVVQYAMLETCEEQLRKACELRAFGASRADVIAFLSMGVLDEAHERFGSTLGAEVYRFGKALRAVGTEILKAASASRWLGWLVKWWMRGVVAG